MIIYFGFIHYKRNTWHEMIFNVNSVIYNFKIYIFKQLRFKTNLLKLQKRNKIDLKI